MRELFKGIAAFFISLLIFLVLLEVTLQIYTRLFIYYDVEMSRYAIEVKEKSDDPNIGHEHKPNAQARLMGVDVVINSDGLRDEEYSVERNEKYRIAVLGDSLTFGSAADVAVTVDVIFPPAGASIGAVIMIEMSSNCALPKVVTVGLMITSLSMLAAFIVKVSV